MATMTLATDESALLASVVADPEDDAPRLVYADWMDEHRQPERAAFIRVQCEMWRIDHDSAAWDGALWDRLEERALKLWQTDAAFPLSQLPEVPGQTLAYNRNDFEIIGWGGRLEVRRGFVASVALPLAAFLGGQPCPSCGGLKRGDLVQPAPGYYLACGSGTYANALVVSLNPFALVSLRGDMLWTATHRPGTVMRIGRAAEERAAFERWERERHKYQKNGPGDGCPACSGTGRAGGCAGGLSGQPVERVELTDREPDSDGKDTDANWWNAGRSGAEPYGHPQSEIPPELYSLLTGWADNDGRRAHYPSADAARRALSAAACAYMASLRG